jgi:transcriptional regulator with XRE-family HTH domain
MDDFVVLDPERVAAAQARAGLTWRDVMRRSGINAGTLARLRAGRSVHRSSAERLAETLGVAASELLARPESPEAPAG